VRLSVIIPAWNEAERLGPTVRATVRWLAQEREPSELLVVDDGSTDRTPEVVAQLARELSGVRLIAGDGHHGKGHAVRLGMLAARGRERLFMDADGATSIDQLPRLRAARADVAIGSRRMPGARLERAAPLHRRAWSRVAGGVVRAALLPGIRDSQCGFKLFTAGAARQLFEPLMTPGWGFDLELLARARRLGLTIAEVPVVWRDDRRSRLSPWRDALAISRDFVRIRLRLAREARR
jgi:dolichyl-phosphate beta-glucosyltransferase